MRIDLDRIKQKCGEFKKLEGRASFFDMAKEIADEHPLQACVLVLATWNAGRFRWFMSNSENLVKLKATINECKILLDRMKQEDIQTVNLDENGDVIKKVYERFSEIKGVEFTGASKIMHLFCPKLIVMWDSYIRKRYKFGASPKDFLDFQKRMKKEFGHIKWDEPNKTLAKAIDEYNYMTITFPKLKSKLYKQ
jgi:hypothetical protein